MYFIWAPYLTASLLLLCCCWNWFKPHEEKKIKMKKEEKAVLLLNNGLCMLRETFLLNSSFCTSNAAVFFPFHLELVNPGPANERRGEDCSPASLLLGIYGLITRRPWNTHGDGRVRLHSASARTDCCSVYELITNLSQFINAAEYSL